MSSYLEIRHLTQRFSFNGKDALVFQDLNFGLGKGEFLCILGASGCGKTTLLRCLAGFLKPVEGKIFIEGIFLENPGKHCSMVFQTFDQLLPWKTVLGNVSYPLFINKDTKRTKTQSKEIAREYLSRVGLSKFLEYYPHQLSGGMKQRVAIARALALQPSLILMDEPFASLDADTRTILQKELLHIWKEYGITVLFVTHSIIEAISISTKMMVLGPDAEGIKIFMDNPVEGESGVPRSPKSPRYSECWTLLANMIRRETATEITMG
jgi:NitT/TauT family transport system ATP-binding protein